MAVVGGTHRQGLLLEFAQLQPVLQFLQLLLARGEFLFHLRDLRCRQRRFILEAKAVDVTDLDALRRNVSGNHHQNDDDCTWKYLHLLVSGFPQAGKKTTYQGMNCNRWGCADRDGSVRRNRTVIRFCNVQSGGVHSAAQSGICAASMGLAMK